MKRVSLNDRPREKLARVGVDALGDNELLAILLGQGSRPRNALELANELLSETGGLHGLARTRPEALCRQRGIGATKAARIVAAVEIGRRTLLEWAADRRPILASPREAAAFLVPQFGARAAEHFGVLLLDARLRVIRTTLLSTGALDGTYVHPRELFREAVTGGASAVMLFHNHPSGDPSPSPDDIALTRRMYDAGELIGIAVVDHLVLGDNQYYSFREHSVAIGTAEARAGPDAASDVRGRRRRT